MAAQKQNKGKRPDSRPARKKYWASGRLAAKKIRSLMRSGYSPEEALKLWEASRKRNTGPKGKIVINYWRIKDLRK